MRGKTRYLWGKDATGGLKTESHPIINRGEKYLHYAQGWGEGERHVS